MTTTVEDYVKLAEQFQESHKDEKWSIHDTRQLANFARWIEEINGGSVDNAPLRAVRVELQRTQDRLQAVSVKSMRRRAELRRLHKKIVWYNDFIYQKAPLREIDHHLRMLEEGKMLNKEQIVQLRRTLDYALQR